MVSEERRMARRMRREVERIERGLHAAAVRIAVLLEAEPDLGAKLAAVVMGGGEKFRPAAGTVPDFWKERNAC